MRRVGRVLGTLAGLLAYVSLSACSTTQAPQPGDPDAEISASAPETSSAPISESSADPDQQQPAPLPDTALDAPLPNTPLTDPLPSTIVDVPDVGLGAAVEPVTPEPLLERPDPFSRLTGWSDADHAPALAAFQQSCATLLKRPAKTALHAKRAGLGKHSDWAMVCRAAGLATNATPFFESLFVPMVVSEGASGETGLLTGYYEPEVEVRAKADAEFSEPILAEPTSDAVRTLPRAKLNAKSATVIAYGRPIDVFFLQVQGSGRLHFEDGRTVRAGYAANNGKPYRSIGRVLIERGELTREQSAKRNIEQWMDDAGPEKSRALMNENPRYIFFSKQDIPDGQGPKGAMQVPLTAMGSIAIDPKHNPYGIPVWINTRLPQKARDYQGASTGLLVVTQDTGSAIRGPQRGDLFFGAGPNAGALAGVMKHPARWTMLVPRTLVERLARLEEPKPPKPVA